MNIIVSNNDVVIKTVFGVTMSIPLVNVACWAHNEHCWQLREVGSSQWRTFRTRRGALFSRVMTEKCWTRYADTVQLPEVSSSGDNAECIICLDRTGDNDDMRKTRCCGQACHVRCLAEWFIASRPPRTCPACRCCVTSS